MVDTVYLVLGAVAVIVVAFLVYWFFLRRGKPIQLAISAVAVSNIPIESSVPFSGPLPNDYTVIMIGKPSDPLYKPRVGDELTASGSGSATLGPAKYTVASTDDIVLPGGKIWSWPTAAGSPPAPAVPEGQVGFVMLVDMTESPNQTSGFAGTIAFPPGLTYTISPAPDF